MDVRIGWAEFDTQAAPFDVRVGWAEFDAVGVPFNVCIGWCELDCYSPTVDPIPPYVPPVSGGGGIVGLSGGRNGSRSQVSRYYNHKHQKYEVPILVNPASVNTEEEEEEIVLALLMEVARNELF